MGLKISCIMPTRGRRQLAEASLQCFLNQDYPERELLILDDHDDRSFPDGVQHDLVRYHVADRRMNIPQKRNELCRMATGDVIAHWDSDDWNHPGRLAHQSALIHASGKSVVAYRQVLFHGTESNRVWKYIGDQSGAVGTSLMYRRAWWGTYPFPPGRNIGEDSHLANHAFDAGQLHNVDGEGYIVARIHDGNTAKKDPSEQHYHRRSLSDLPPEYPR
jgi:glycosyltransferase involved in cell wall biosynthesis